MIPSLNTGVSGLKANQSQINVVGNNIANVNTTAYKRSRANFSEVLGQEMLGTNRQPNTTPPHHSTMGRGVTVGSVDQNWTQGRLENTNVATDLALSNDGFFVARSNSNRLLTRAGNFTFNNQGQLVTSSGLQVQGYSFDENGKVNMTGLKDIQLDAEKTAPPRATEKLTIGGNLSAEATSGLDIDGTLKTGGTQKPEATFDVFGETVKVRFRNDSGDKWNVQYKVDGGSWKNVEDANGNANPVDFSKPVSGLKIPSNSSGGLSNAGSDVYLDLSDVETTTGSTGLSSNPPSTTTQSIRAFDAKGKSHTLNVELMKTSGSSNGPSDTWQYRLTDSDGNTLSKNTGTLSFNADGQIKSINGNAISSDDYTVSFNWDKNGDGSSEEMTLSFGNKTNAITHYNGSTTASFKGQDGYSSGALEGYSFTPEGILRLNYDNGTSEDLFQLALGRVDNKDGLKQQGTNMYSTTYQSGSLRLGRAGKEFGSAVVAGSLEQSNVDLATEFTSMIRSQRGYQAAARVITTSDEILQETVQLKR